jgi:antitoxin ParD1/3/4
VQQLHISLSPEYWQIIQNKIDSGYYANATEVIRDALRRMQESDQNHRLTVLRTELALGLEQAERGELLDLDLDAIEAEAVAELKAGNADVKNSATY